MTYTPWWMVVLLGMGIVTAGLGLMVLMCAAIRLLARREIAAPAAPLAQSPDIPPAQRRQMLAAVAAAIAETENTDVSGIRIVSFTRRAGA